MKAKPVEINWHPGLPIFARESFLKAVGDEYGWLGGFSDNGALRCILPYTIIRKAIFRMVRFRVETIPLGEGLDIQDEKLFLRNAVEYFRSLGADMVIPGSNNAIFSTYPDGANAAPYGSYVIDLGQTQDVLWKNIDRITRQNIKTAIKKGVSVRSGSEYLDRAYVLVRDTFKRSKLSFMSLTSFKKFVNGLGEYGKIMIADCQGVAQSYVLFAFSEYCAYAVYAGNIVGQINGENKLLYWEAIRQFKELGIRLYDFMGARVNPKPGSKQEALSLFKRRFGATLKQGYIWKYPIHPMKYRLYCLAARLRSGGDLVDAEHHKLRSSSTVETE